MEIKHTPTPWEIYSNNNADPYSDILIQGKDSDYAIARISLDDAPVKDFNVEQRANAAFIVKCVNAHEELVEALRFLVEVTEAYFVDVDDTGESAIEGAKAALAKAEGQK